MTEGGKANRTINAREMRGGEALMMEDNETLDNDGIRVEGEEEGTLCGL